MASRLAFLPETQNVYFRDAGSKALLSTFASTYATSQLCPTRDGMCWVYSPTLATLTKVNPVTGATITSFTPAVALDQGGMYADKGNKALFERNNGNLIGRNASTGYLVELSKTTGAVVQTFGLNLSVLDGSLNPAGTILLYIVGNEFRRWDLTTDAIGGPAITFASGVSPADTNVPDDSPSHYPNWIQDGTIIFAVGQGYLQDAYLVRMNFAGIVLQRYKYNANVSLSDPGLPTFAEGVYGLAVDYRANRIYLTGDNEGGDFGLPSDDVVTLLEWNYGTAELLAQYQLDQISVDHDNGSAMAVIIDTDIIVPPDAVPPTVPTTSPGPKDCNPPPTVGNGGKGASGCNEGGVGMVPSYPLTAAFGAVPQHDDPVDGELLTGKGELDIWVELVHTSYPSEEITTYRRAFEELGDV